MRASKRRTWKHHLHELTVGRARAQVLDFDEVRLERRVDPLEDVIAAEIVRGDTGVVDIDGGHLERVGKGQPCARTRAVRLSESGRPIFRSCVVYRDARRNGRLS